MQNKFIYFTMIFVFLVLITGISAANGTGKIYVHTSPFHSDNATFTISGPETYSGNGSYWTKTNASAGTYTINYEPVSGYRTPASETKTLTAGGSITFHGKYYNKVKIDRLKPKKSASPHKELPEPKMFPLTSAPPHKELSFKSSPKGADVYLNGVKIGKTPMEYPITSPNVLSIRLKLNGYNSWEGQYNPKQDLVEIKGSSKSTPSMINLPYDPEDESYVIFVPLIKNKGK